MLLSNYNFYRVKNSMYVCRVCDNLLLFALLQCKTSSKATIYRGRSRKILIRVLQTTSRLFQIVHYNALL